MTRKRGWESEGREEKGKPFFLCSWRLAARSLIALFATRNGELARRLLEQLESLKLDYQLQQRNKPPKTKKTAIDQLSLAAIPLKRTSEFRG